jgi:hypothetical protein
MGNKKKKAGSHRSHLKHQKLLANFQLNDSAVLALTTPHLTVHAILTSNSNSKQRPPVASATVSSQPTLHTLSSPHSSPPYHGDPNINHIFMEDWFGDDDQEDEEVDFNSSVEDYVGASTFFTSPVVGASPVDGQSKPVASPAVAQSTPPPLPPAVGSIPPSSCCASPTSNVAGAQPTPSPLPPAEKIPSPPPEKSMTPSSLLPGCCESSPSTVAGKPFSAPGSNKWRDLFSNRSTVSYTRLQNFSLNHLSKTCAISSEDIQPAFDVLKYCVVGYVSGKRPGYGALNSIISNVWKCEAILTIHDSGWLVYRFKIEEAKLAVLSGGPYLVYGRPLILRPMTKNFDFSSEEMSRVPVWVKFPNLPLCCWSPICLSKIVSVLGKRIQCDQPTSTLSRMSYARVLVEIDLLEELQHSVEITLPEGPFLHQQVVYETLPKYCHLCHVLGHTHLLCPKAVATATTVPCPPLAPAVQEAHGNVFSRLGPSPLLQSSPPLPQLQDQSQAQYIPASQGVVGSPVDLVATNDWVTVVSRHKSSKHDKGKAIAVSELGSVFPVYTGPVRPSSGAPPLVANSCAEEPRDSPPSTEPLVLPAWASEGRNPSPPNPLAITTDDGNMADKPVSPPIVEVSVKSRVRNRNQKHSGRSGRTSPSIGNS